VLFRSGDEWSTYRVLLCWLW